MALTPQRAVNMRKKPAQARASATIDAIIEAASQILQREGEDAVTTGRIAERAGVSIGSLYQYFPNRDAILIALIGRQRQEIVAQIARSLSQIEAQSGEEVVRSVIATLVAAFRPRRGRRRLVALASMMRAESGDQTARLLDSVGDLVLENSRRFPPFAARPLTRVSAYVLTRAVMGAIRSALVENSKILDEPEFEEELARLAASYLRG